MEGLSGLPKSSFGEHKVVTKGSSMQMRSCKITGIPDFISFMKRASKAHSERLVRAYQIVVWEG